MFSGRAWRVVKFGEPEVAAQLQELTWDVPPPAHVLVRVRTAGAGFPDRMMTAGQYPLVGEPPFGLGQEAAGEVVAVLPGSRFAVGDEITGIAAFREGWGSYADYAYVRERSAMRIPPSMTVEQAGGFPIGFRTAYAALVERAPVAVGQTLVILGAAGSAGSTALQLGKALGATVIAVAGSQEKLDFCAGQGADYVINHRTEDLTERFAAITDGQGVDLIYDAVGGDTAAIAIKSLARNGRIALVGVASGRPAPIDPMDLLLRNYSAVGVLAVPNDGPKQEAAVWERLATLVAQGEITTPVGTVYDFDEVPRMIAQQHAPAPGKSVVRVSQR